MIGIIGALPIEVAALRKQMLHVKETRLCNQLFYTGQLGGRDVALTCCGVGKVHAARAAQLCICGFSPDAIINTGVAGALAPGLKTGDVVIASALVQHDMDTTALGDPWGYVSGCDTIFFPADDALSTQLLHHAEALFGTAARLGVIASGDAFIADKKRSGTIHTHFSAAAVDMESAAMAQICMLSRVAFCAVRTISDSADGDSPSDFGAFLRLASENAQAILFRFLEHAP